MTRASQLVVLRITDTHMPTMGKCTFNAREALGTTRAQHDLCCSFYAGSHRPRTVLFRRGTCRTHVQSSRATVCDGVLCCVHSTA